MRWTARISAAVAAASLTAVIAMPAMAAEIPRHMSCHGFGHVFAAWAQGDAKDAGFRNGGQGIKSTALNGLLIPDVVDAQPPGSVAEVIHWEHSLFCESS